MWDPVSAVDNGQASKAGGLRVALAALVLAGALSGAGGLAAGAQARSSSPRVVDPASGCLTVHVGPIPAPGAPLESYFRLRLAPGRSIREALILANPELRTCQVLIEPAYGMTATNSGDTYPVTGGGPEHCRLTSCWLSGLPVIVAIEPRQRAIVPFTVSVPARTPGGQYLAGVVAGPASPPSRVVSRSEAGAVVVAHVAIGVSIRVPGPLVPSLSIPRVTVGSRRPTAILVTERDSGNTWEHPRGQVVIGTGPQARRFPIASATILPGGSATLTMTVGQVRSGTWLTQVDLWYDRHRKKAVWSGFLNYSQTDAAGGSPVSAQLSGWPPGMPSWAMAVILVLGLQASVSLVLLFMYVARRRQAR